MSERDAEAVREAAAATNEQWREVSIAGDVVTRPAHAGSAAVHAFLRHLRDRGVVEVPEPLGLNETTETLRLIPGASGGEGWYHQHTTAGLQSAARLLRRVHDAGQDWTPPPGAGPGEREVPGDDVVWCHGDPGPWNMVWRDDEAVGLLDWDLLHRGPRIDDVAYALRWFAPLRNDTAVLEWHHFPVVPDRGARVVDFLDAYGRFDGDDEDVVDAVAARIGRSIDRLAALAEQGREPQRTWVADGYLELERAEVRWLLEHRELLNPLS